MNHWHHLVHILRTIRDGEKQAERSGNAKESALAAVCYIVVGFFLAPMLVGIPIMLYGLYKLVKS